MIANVIHAVALVSAWVQGAIEGKQAEIFRRSKFKPEGYRRTAARGKTYKPAGINSREAQRRLLQALPGDQITFLSDYTKDGKCKATARRKLVGFVGKWWPWNKSPEGDYQFKRRERVVGWGRAEKPMTRKQQRRVARAGGA